MDTFFPDLYGIVNLKPSAEVLAARWAAVASLVESATRGRIVALVRVSAGSAGADAAAVVEAARSADSAFQAVSGAAEIRVLASGALCELLKTSSAAANAAALATLTLALYGRRGDELSKHVQRAAKHYLDEAAVRAREGETISTALTAENRKAVMQAYQAAATPHGQNVAAVGEPIANLVNQLTEPYVVAIAGLRDQLAALREEAEMCWWLLTGYSQHLQRRFTEIGLPATCLVAARELAEMTRLLPGPRAATALLDRVVTTTGGTPDALSIPEAVNATPREWRATWLRAASPSAIGNLAPILVGLQHSVATESETDWISAFAKSTDIHDVRFTPLALALQAYSETLLVRAMNMLGE